MPFCPHCGKEIEDGTVFCPYCGFKINASSETLSKATPNSNPPQAAKVMPETKGANKNGAVAKGTDSSTLVISFVGSALLAGILLAYVATKGWDVLPYAVLFVCCLFILMNLIRTLTYVPSENARIRFRKKLSPDEASLESKCSFDRGGVSLFFKYAGAPVIVISFVFFIINVVLLSLLSLV
jgi:hypothetical protein